MHTSERIPVPIYVPRDFLGGLSSLRQAEADDRAADQAREEAEAWGTETAEMVERARMGLARFLWSKRRPRENYGDEGAFSPVVVHGGKAYLATTLAMPDGKGPYLMVLDLADPDGVSTPAATEPPAPSSIEAAARELVARRRELDALYEREQDGDSELDRADRAYVRAQDALQELMLADPEFVPRGGDHGRPLLVDGLVIFLDRWTLKEPDSYGLTVLGEVDLAGRAPRATSEDALVEATDPPDHRLLAALAERDRLAAIYLAMLPNNGETKIQEAWDEISRVEGEIHSLAKLAGLIPAEPDPCSTERATVVVGNHVLIFDFDARERVSMTITKARYLAEVGGGA
jgi:hypothetical protein